MTNKHVETQACAGDCICVRTYRALVIWRKRRAVACPA